MMKKIYTKPEVLVIEIIQQVSLLTISGEGMRKLVIPDEEDTDLVPVQEGLDDEEEDV